MRDPAATAGSLFDRLKGRLMFTALREKVQESAAPLFSAPQSSKTRRAEAWLTAQIEKMNKSGAHAVLDHLVYPELAEVLIAHNGGNRRLKPKHVDNLARAMKEGRWINTGHPIIVTRSARVRDAQHRLHAIAASGVPIVMDIRFGIDDAAFKVMDIGRKRIGADVLDIEGMHNTNITAAAAKMIWFLGRGQFSAVETNSGGDFTPDVLLDFVNKNSVIHDAARIGHNTGQALKCAAAPVAVATFLIAKKYGIEKTEEFFGSLRSGVGYSSTRVPLARLRDFILKEQYQGRVDLAATVVVAWNHHVKKRHSALSWDRDDGFPEVI